MTQSNRFTLVATILLAMGALLLGGCEQTPGYSENPPPAGGPQQNSHVPPGEKPGAAPESAQSR
ncbi:hypothetical protein EON83_04920 [bacterium]|nr:MAG: hypothetical protein EON83_04920 [bacterium]